MTNVDLVPFKRIPVLEVARRLGIKIRGNKAMCFTGHDRATPSLSFKPGTNTWKCFGACGKHGDGINLAMEVRGVDFKSALAWFQIEFSIGVVVPSGSHRRRERQIAPPLLPQTVSRGDQEKFAIDPEIYDWLVNKCGTVSAAAGLAYLERHAISPEAAARFQVRELRNPTLALRQLTNTWGTERVYRSGLVSGDTGARGSLIWRSYALLFPFFESGVLTYIQGRMFEGRAKYLNPRGVPKPLFNSDRLNDLPPRSIVHICEGVPDAIALESNGLAAVAVLGATSFRTEWVDRLMGFDVVVAPDGDAGGRAFLSTIRQSFLARGKAVRTVQVPPGQDVSSVLAKWGANQ